MTNFGLTPAIFCSDLGFFLGGLGVGVYPQGVWDSGAMQYGGVRLGHQLAPLVDVPQFGLVRGADLEGLSAGEAAFVAGRSAAEEFARDIARKSDFRESARGFENAARFFGRNAYEGKAQGRTEVVVAAAAIAELGAFVARGFGSGAVGETDTDLLLARPLHGLAADFWLAALETLGNHFAEDRRPFINRGILNAWQSIGNVGAMRSLLDHSRARNELGEAFLDAGDDSMRLAYLYAHGCGDMYRASFLAVHDAMGEAKRLWLLGGRRLKKTQSKALQKFARDAFDLHSLTKAGRSESAIDAKMFGMSAD